MSKDESTIELMEVTDDVKAQFRVQSGGIDLKFLVRALDLINQADVQYKGSNHQRLLVELTLMQMASLGEAQKKKPSLNHHRRKTPGLPRRCWIDALKSRMQSR